MVRKTKHVSLETREQILDAAEWCFSTHGSSRATLEMIAREAHCTRGAIYWHFDEKTEILQAVLERGRWSLLAQLETLTFSSSDVLTRLGCCLKQCLAEIQNSESTFRSLEILSYRCDFSQEHLKLLTRQRDDISRMMELLQILLEKAKKLGELRSYFCCYTAANLLGCLLVGAIRIHLMRGNSLDIKEKILPLLDMTIASFRD